jgi:hypothetical protein
MIAIIVKITPNTALLITSTNFAWWHPVEWYRMECIVVNNIPTPAKYRPFIAHIHAGIKKQHEVNTKRADPL